MYCTTDVQFTLWLDLYSIPYFLFFNLPSFSLPKKSGDAKYSIPQALGADKYKATIKRADELFKMKRYSEAKPIYEEALKQKPNDAAATNKLAEIEKLIKK